MSSAAVVKRWCFSVTAKPRSLKLCMMITTFLELYISQELDFASNHTDMCLFVFSVFLYIFLGRVVGVGGGCK